MHRCRHDCKQMKGKKRVACFMPSECEAAKVRGGGGGRGAEGGRGLMYTCMNYDTRATRIWPKVAAAAAAAAVVVVVAVVC